MPILVVQSERHAEQQKALLKSITVIGSDPIADLRILDPLVPNVAAHLHRSANGYTISSASSDFPIFVNGVRIAKQAIIDQDRISIGKTQLQFLESTPQKAHSQSEAPNQKRELMAYNRLAEFSNKLAIETEIPKLLETLIDEIIALTRGERAFLVLVENGQAKVRVARNMEGETLGLAVNQMSDSILNRVLETRNSLVVSDALHDKDFNASASVINFKLTSVMCVPLVTQGQLLGAIYVGNNSVVNAFDEESIKLLSIFAGQAALIVQNALRVNALTQEANELKANIEQSKFGSIIGSSSGMQHIFQTIDKVAKAEVSILITGETGTGKELVARELHRRSNRAQGPFVVINCGAIPENLLESELFGHVRGAFTGATVTRIGKFQAAHQGTLFLDEIGEMPLHLQVKILRVLQDHSVTKVGDNKSDQVDIRVIAATNRVLPTMVSQGTFREDLYYRLNVVQTNIPPLRERGNDVILIGSYFLQKYAKIYGKSIIGFTEPAQNALINYNWPGNVRQLENKICRAVVMCDHDRIRPIDLDIIAVEEENVLPLSEAIDRFRAKYIADSLERNAGNRTRAAKELAVDPRTIFRHLEEQKKGIDAGYSL